MSRNAVKKIAKAMLGGTKAALYFWRCKLWSIPLPAGLNWNSVPVLNRRRGKKKLQSRSLGCAAPTFRDFWGTALCGVHRWFSATNWLDDAEMDGESWQTHW
jgi:hypothetical protein